MTKTASLLSFEYLKDNWRAGQDEEIWGRFHSLPLLQIMTGKR